ncbi:DUF421 domain-containing protein [Caldalkalibacillus salinus]|uniref:DUF421 domain-containing protein n=1 Tax=Caldalkalibacillus salinus TaxID=2803787 RepID=UPI00192061C5|nr:DUF421 domain-containing protein [Caldalkalibacillus salinus]
MPDMVVILVRGLLGFILLFFFTRLIGKKQINQITYFEYIVGIAIGGIAAELTFSPDVRMANFILGMVIWGLLPILVAKLELKSHRFRTMTEGRPTFLVRHGRVLEDNMKKENMTVDELMIHLRQNNAFKLSEVESAIMETSGQVSVLKKSDRQPLTPKDVGMNVKPEHQPRLVIIDGNVMENSLNTYGYSKAWLLDQVKKQGASTFSDVFLAQLDSKGNVYMDLYNDQKEMPEVKQKVVTAASIKQLQSDLERFAVQTENEEAKQMFKRKAQQMDQLLDEISVYIKES